LALQKVKKAFFCQNCGFQAPKWMGKCPSCGEWNTLVEEIITKTADVPGLSLSSERKGKPKPLADISSDTGERTDTKDSELNRVLGGGIVPGSVILLGGEPGIGKSTLLLQTALRLNDKKVLYISGEESETQIKLRADRMEDKNDHCLVLAENGLENILAVCEQEAPDLVIIDSIQTLHYSIVESSPGSISQVRECAARLIRFAKETGIPMVLVGHINKEGSIAGPKVLEHMTDVVLQFEGDRHHLFRILRASKNRYGSTSEIGIYEMKGNGLMPVLNPSSVLLGDSEFPLSGTAVGAAVEGQRPFLIEVQALVSTAVYGTPQRSANGFDNRRLNMLLAVLEKRCGFHLGAKDVFLNITGGLRIEDPAIDLAVVCAVLSSNEDVCINRRYVFAGEVGLTGEIRPVNRMEMRISEAQKLGFEKIFLPTLSKKMLQGFKPEIELIGISKIEDLFRNLLT
jgi:DNA repair protein RadA/Sms